MKDQHLIKDIRFFRAKSPISQPIADATHSISDIDFFVTEIETASGVIGQSNGPSGMSASIPWRLDGSLLR